MVIRRGGRASARFERRGAGRDVVEGALWAVGDLGLASPALGVGQGLGGLHLAHRVEVAVVGGLEAAVGQAASAPALLVGRGPGAVP